MDSLGELLEQLTELEKEKAAAVRRDDLLAVDECMKKEQVLSLTLRTMDKKRDTLLAGMNLRNVRLSDFEQKCPEELRKEAHDACEKLRTRYMLYRSAADVARTTLECNLHQIERMLADEAESPAGGAIADIRA
jgi:vacuolar-type H+-ATPase subunit I/STV1